MNTPTWPLDREQTSNNSVRFVLKNKSKLKNIRRADRVDAPLKKSYEKEMFGYFQHSQDQIVSSRDVVPLVV